MAAGASVANIGLVGLGRVGLPLGRHLMEAGHHVLGYRRGDSSDFETAGGQRAPSCTSLAAQADIILTCLPSPEALAEVVSGPGGLIHGARPGLVVVELSTLPLEAKDEQRRALESVGGAMLDCPISGTPPMVEQRKAAVFVSGDEPAYERCRPVLEAASDTVSYVGVFGAGSKLKYIANLLVATHTLATAEAMTLARYTGVEPARALEVLKASAGSSVMFSVRAPMVLEDRYLPAPGPVDMMRKDLQAARSEIKRSGTQTPLFDLVTQWYDEASAAGLGEHDIAAVGLLLARGASKEPAGSASDAAIAGQERER